jgi:hypothetical protein
VKLNTFEQRFPAYASSGLSIELISAPGRGKSQTIRRCRDRMSELDGEEWGYAELFLATQTPPDLIGFQFKGEITYDGKAFAITDPTAPSWFITETNKPVFAYKRGILHLEEFGQGQTDVKAAAAELLLNRRIGKWRLPDGWIVIASSNRTSDRSGVTKSLDFIINRRKEIHVDDDLQSWLDWALTSGVMPLTMAFAAQNPHIVFSDGVPEKQGPWCTPRSLVMADKDLQSLAKFNNGELPVDDLAMEDVSGTIGAAAAAQYFAFVRLEREMPKFEDIVAKPTVVNVPDRPDAQMLVCYNLAHRIDETTADAVVQYMERFDKEMGVIFIKAATQRNYKLLSTPSFRKWCSTNASIMAAVN